MSKRIQFDLQVKASYKPLWKLLVDKDKLKQDLREEAKLSSTTMARLNNGDNVTTDVLLRICQVLNCQVGDIVEVVATNESKEHNE
ncbi:helix-turn-helix domain-containing protein [Corynebacterium propinquum]|uniref:helix-turn-helix domain-containing protein n=1 Tax=Corynebacterium propinquum TaxID=43769 RepID=UPI000665009E|nr:helix-turn-helix domain-containing protein [Corynebacterium propinquum]